MPLIDVTSLQSFLGKNNFATKSSELEGHADAIKQAQDVVYQKTKIAIPDAIENAIPILQYCAHAIFIYIISFRQTLKQDEKDRVKTLYDEAMKLLNQISSGELPIKDSLGNISGGAVSNNTFYYSEKEDREERL